MVKFRSGEYATMTPKWAEERLNKSGMDNIITLVESKSWSKKVDTKLRLGRGLAEVKEMYGPGLMTLDELFGKLRSKGFK